MLAIDGGNSKTDVALVAGDGTLLASARGPGINAHEVGVDQTVLILDAVVKQAAAQLDNRPAGPLARHTVACLANADLPEEEVEHATAVQALDVAWNSRCAGAGFGGFVDDALPGGGAARAGASAVPDLPTRED